MSIKYFQRTNHLLRKKEGKRILNKETKRLKAHHEKGPQLLALPLSCITITLTFSHGVGYTRLLINGRAGSIPDRFNTQSRKNARQEFSLTSAMGRTFYYTLIKTKKQARLTTLSPNRQ